MNKYFNLFIALALVLLLGSCQEEYKAPQSATVEMSGRWLNEFIFDANQDGIFNEDDGDELIYPYEDAHVLYTSNTAANDDDSVLIDYPDGAVYFRVKAPINLSALTFLPATVPNINSDFVDDETIRIISGKILKGAALSKSGRVADSIFIEFESAVDPGSFYFITGHRDSGQPEDHY